MNKKKETHGQVFLKKKIIIERREKCREPGLNRHRCFHPLDFKSSASANSAIPALDFDDKWRRRADSNRCIRVLQTPALPLGYAAIYCYTIKS